MSKEILEVLNNQSLLCRLFCPPDLILHKKILKVRVRIVKRNAGRKNIKKSKLIGKGLGKGILYDLRIQKLYPDLTEVVLKLKN